MYSVKQKFEEYLIFYGLLYISYGHSIQTICLANYLFSERTI